MKNKIRELEQDILGALLEDINGCNDPVDMFKGLERYKLFNEARLARAEADSYDAGIDEEESEEGWKKH